MPLEQHDGGEPEARAPAWVRQSRCTLAATAALSLMRGPRPHLKRSHAASARRARAWPCSMAGPAAGAVQPSGLARERLRAAGAVRAPSTHLSRRPGAHSHRCGGCSEDDSPHSRPGSIAAARPPDHQRRVAGLSTARPSSAGARRAVHLAVQGRSSGWRSPAARWNRHGRAEAAVARVGGLQDPPPHPAFSLGSPLGRRMAPAGAWRQTFARRWARALFSGVRGRHRCS